MDEYYHMMKETAEVFRELSKDVAILETPLENRIAFCEKMGDMLIKCAAKMRAEPEPERLAN